MSNEKILIIDDWKKICSIMAQALEPLGYTVAIAVNGEEGLRQLEQQTFDLILLDLRMPGMDGLTFLQQAIRLYPHVKIIIISAHGRVDNAVEAMKLGAIDFIQKPFTPQELRDIVRRVLERETISSKRELEYRTAFELAKQLKNKEQFEEAIVQVKRAIHLNPSQAEAFNLLGELQEKLGDVTKALQNYRIALNLDSAYQSARNNSIRVLQSPQSRQIWLY
ncbi:sigma-54 dependent transcriptional regulator, TPR domain [Stanieria sp. NIES-3757]|nr:sigma-54 dependent transcriptional regulator, TPR domain [Stanieria sp. NIES-3757]